MITLFNILMAQAPAGMTQEEIHASNIHVLHVFLIALGIYLCFTVGAFMFNKILKKTGNHCTFQGAMPLAPIGNIMCFFCRLRFFFMKKTWNSFKALNLQKKNEKEQIVLAKKNAEEAAKKEAFIQRIKEKTKGLTDI